MSFALATGLGLASFSTATAEEELSSPRDGKVAPALTAPTAAGLVVYKLHRQDDEFAPCAEYTSIKLFPTVANMITTDRRYLSVQSGQIVINVTYPPANEELDPTTDIPRLQSRIREYETVGKQYKYAAPRLAPWIAKFKHEIQMLQQGLGRSEGQWGNVGSLTYERKRAALRLKFEKRKAEILGTGEPSATDASDDHGPLWAVALDEERRARQAAYRKAFSKKVAEKEIARAKEFHRTTDSALGNKSDSKLAPPKLKRAESLDSNTSLDLGKGL